MIPSLVKLAATTFITTFSPKEDSKKYFKQKLSLDLQQMICQEIINDHPHLLKHLTYFSADPRKLETRAICELSNPHLSDTEITNILLSIFPNLKKLDLSKTKIKFDQLNISQVKEINLSDCAIISTEEYEMIKEKFPSLNALIIHNTELTSLAGLPSQLEILDLNFSDSFAVNTPGLDDGKGLSKEEFLTLKEKFPNLKKVDLSCTRINSLVGMPPQIEELCLRYHAIPPEEFLTFGSNFPKLKKLSVSWLNVLTGLPSQLEELHLTGNGSISAQEFLNIKNVCPNLKIIYLNLTSIDNLSGLPPQLEELYLNGCWSIPAKEFLIIKELFPNLKKINLAATLIDSLDGLPSQIEMLNLAYCSHIGTTLGISLSQFPYLKDLSVNNTSITSLAKLPSQIETLDLYCCTSLPAKEFLTIKDLCPNLKKIDLNRTLIDSLCGLPSQLEQLGISFCSHIPEAEFLTIKDKFPHLKELSLVSTQVSSLAGLPSQLETLALTDCKHIPAEEFLTIKNRFPHLKLLIAGGTQINSLEGLKGLLQLDRIIISREPGLEAQISPFNQVYPHVRIRFMC